MKGVGKSVARDQQIVLQRLGAHLRNQTVDSVGKRGRRLIRRLRSHKQIHAEGDRHLKLNRYMEFTDSGRT